jgi:hypothetical protein
VWLEEDLPAPLRWGYHLQGMSLIWEGGPTGGGEGGAPDRLAAVAPNSWLVADRVSR